MTDTLRATAGKQQVSIGTEKAASGAPSGEVAGVFESADECMQLAKRKFTAAALSCIKGMPTAERQVAEALAEIDIARRCLRELGYRLAHCGQARR